MTTQARVDASPPSIRQKEGDPPVLEHDRPARSRSQRSLSWVVLILTLGALLAFYPFWAPLLLAAWMANLARPLHSKLGRRTGARGRAAGVVTVALVVLSLAPLVIIGLSLVASAIDTLQSLQGAGGLRKSFSAMLASEPTLSRRDWNLQQVLELARRHGGGAVSTASRVFGMATSAVVGLFIFVYGFYSCLVDGRRAHDWLLVHSPLERRHFTRLVAAFTETGRGLILGVGLAALLQGVLATIGYVVIGVPQALVLGLLTTFAALIPAIGTGLVWVPITIGLFMAGRTKAAIAVLALGTAISVADNFARPHFSRTAHLHLPAFVLFVAMLGGISVFGAWGLLAGPLFVRLALEGWRLYREEREGTGLTLSA
jgi:predicted PurR-regulated permease PerM